MRDIIAVLGYTFSQNATSLPSREIQSPNPRHHCHPVTYIASKSYRLSAERSGNKKHLFERMFLRMDKKKQQPFNPRQKEADPENRLQS